MLCLLRDSREQFQSEGVFFGDFIIITDIYNNHRIDITMHVSFSPYTNLQFSFPDQYKIQYNKVSIIVNSVLANLVQL